MAKTDKARAMQNYARLEVSQALDKLAAHGITVKHPFSGVHYDPWSRRRQVHLGDLPLSSTPFEVEIDKALDPKVNEKQVAAVRKQMRAEAIRLVGKAIEGEEDVTAYEQTESRHGLITKVDFEFKVAGAHKKKISDLQAEYKRLYQAVDKAREELIANIARAIKNSLFELDKAIAISALDDAAFPKVVNKGVADLATNVLKMVPKKK